MKKSPFLHCAFLIIVSLAVGFQAKDWISPRQEVSQFPWSECTVQSVAGQVNELRRSLGLQELQWDYRLAEDARRRNMQFIDGSPWNHDKFSTTQYVSNAYGDRGENIAKDGDLCEVFQAWKDSPSHYAGMTNDHSLVGIAQDAQYITLHTASVR